MRVEGMDTENQQFEVIATAFFADLKKKFS